MIDFKNLEHYQENNRIEAKRALGGLPHSIWETYSAFANTLGGIILLGVEEYKDKTFHPIKLPDPQQLIEDFSELLCDPKKVNRNILSEDDITIEHIEEKEIVAIRVPRAMRYLRPIYIDGNPMTGTYRRNGEGDYRCTPAEVRKMMQDAEMRSMTSEQMAQTIVSVREIISYLTEKITATGIELAALIGEHPYETDELLEHMIEKEILIFEHGYYQLKA